MTTRELVEELDKVLEEFHQEVRSNSEEMNREHCTKDDMENLARQTFYALEQFKSHIVRYLRELK